MTLTRSAAIIAALGTLLGACSGAPSETRVQLRILETTDLHAHIVDYDYFQDEPSVSVGLARTAALIESARAAATNSVLVDNGDLLQGSPLGDFVARRRGLESGEVHAIYRAMNLLDYTVGNIGNHEFNYGLPFLDKSVSGANFPYISANVFHDDGDDDPGNDVPLFEQYLIVDRELLANDGTRHPVRIGFIGFVPPQIMSWDRSNLKGRVVAADMVAMAEQLVPQMRREGADIVVAIPHSGLSTRKRQGMDENATYYLSQVPGIDAILFGHSHRVFPGDDFANIAGVDLDKGTVNDVPATMPGKWGSHLGVVDLSLSVDDRGNWHVVEGRGSVMPIAARDGRQQKALVDPVQEILDAVATDHEATLEYMRTGVGVISAPIFSYFAQVLDDPSIQIVTDAQRHYVERLIKGTEYDGLPVLSASAPFKTGGRSGVDYYTRIQAGEVALKDIADLYVYPNTLRAVLFTGAEVREWLEMSAGAFNTIDPASPREQPLMSAGFASFNFDVIDGVSYRIDITRLPRYSPDGDLLDADTSRIVDLMHEGKPVSDDQEFIVATNNYRADGGGGFPGMDGSSIVIEAPDTNRDVLAAFIYDKDTIDPMADGNWAFAPINDDVNVTFVSSPAAAETLQENSPIEFVRVDGDGFGVYRISFAD